MPLIDATALPQEGAGSRGGGGASAASGGGGGFLQALLETPELKKAGVGEGELKAALRALREGGEGLPQGGDKLPQEVLALLGDLLGGAPGQGGEAPSQEGELSGLLDALQQGEQSERIQVLRALAELEGQGMSGRELAAALQEQLAELEEAGALDLEEADALESEGQAAFAGGIAKLLGAAEGGEGERLRSQVGQGSAVGEQIVRELRAGGLLSGMPAGGGGGGLDGGGERAPNAEALQRALQGGGEGGEEAASRRGGDFSQLLSGQQVASGARGTAAALTIPQPVGQNGFTPALGDRIQWMASEGVQRARLELNPPGMGPLDIQVTVGEERTTVNITTHNAATREALESELARLRQMLADQGQTEVEVNVSGREQEGQGSGEPPAGGEAAGSEGGDHQEPVEPAAASSGRGLIDHYA